jgi:Asp-tRNA(Asn)/Glu-tRNA(Gln) amidotransferase A subunit family amidase
MKDYDFLITPSTASVAPKIGENEKMDTSLIWTFFGVPAISLPIFYDEKTKLPFGLQIISSRYNDLLLLDFCEKIIKNFSKKN